MLRKTDEIMFDRGRPVSRCNETGGATTSIAKFFF